MPHEWNCSGYYYEHLDNFLHEKSFTNDSCQERLPRVYFFREVVPADIEGSATGIDQEKSPIVLHDNTQPHVAQRIL